MKFLGKVPKVAGNVVAFFSNSPRSAGRMADVIGMLLKVFTCPLTSVGNNPQLICGFLKVFVLRLNGLGSGVKSIALLANNQGKGQKAPGFSLQVSQRCLEDARLCLHASPSMFEDRRLFLPVFCWQAALKGRVLQTKLTSAPIALLLQKHPAAGRNASAAMPECRALLLRRASVIFQLAALMVSFPASRPRKSSDFLMMF